MFEIKGEMLPSETFRAYGFPWGMTVHLPPFF
jgi:hypothetical protein